MASNKEIPLHFQFSFDKLLEKCINVSSQLRADLHEFTDRSITINRLDKFDYLRNQFMIIPAQKVQRIAQIAESDQVKVNVKVLDKLLREIRDIIRNHFQSDSPEYKSLKIARITTWSAVDLYIKSEHIVEKARDLKSELSNKGLNEALINETIKARIALWYALESQDKSANDSPDLITNQRIAANVLFDELQSMCNIASAYYTIKNPDKLKQYNITKGIAKWITRKSDINPGEVKSPKVSVITPTTVISVKVTSKKGVQCYFSGKKKAMPPATAIMIKPDTKKFTEITAASLGFNKKMGITILNIYNPNADIASFVIKMK